MILTKTTPLTPSDLAKAVLTAIHTNGTFQISDANTSYKQQEFLEAVDKQIQCYKDLGTALGDRILISSGRGVDFWRDVLAAWALNAVIVPLASAKTNPHLEYIVDLVQPKIIDSELNKTYTPESPTENILKVRTSAPIGAIIFTSGSTGVPKGALLSAKTLLQNAKATQLRLNLTPNHRLLIPIPSHFVSAISHYFVSSLSGASIVLNENVRFPAELQKMIETMSVNAIGGAPLHLRWLCELPENTPIAWAMSSGDRLGAETALKLLNRFPNLQLRVVYGLTELGGRFCIANNEQVLRLPATVGTPIEGLNISIDDDGTSTGNVIVSGESLMDGYLSDFIKNPNFKPISSFNTGDVGKTTDGLLELTGRSDDVFKVSGLKVASPEVAEVLMQTGLFKDVYVSQTEIPHVGTVVAAYYTSDKDVDVTLPQVLPILRQKLAAHAVPRLLKRLPDIPRTGSGKINRKKIQEIVASMVAP